MRDERANEGDRAGRRGTRDPGSGSVLFIGTQFSNLYTAVDTPARGRVGKESRRCIAAAGPQRPAREVGAVTQRARRVRQIVIFLLQHSSRGNMELFPISSGGGQFTFVPLTLWYKFAIKYVLDFSWEEKFWPSVPTWGVVFFIQSSFKFVLYLVLTSYSPNSLAF